MKKSNQDDIKKILKPYRLRIDALDDQILKLLGERFKVVEKVAQIKEKNDIPAYLGPRVVEVRERNAKTGKKYGIDPDLVRMIYNLIIYKSCQLEEDHKTKMASRKKGKK